MTQLTGADHGGAVFGIDIGGSGIKGAPVDLGSGRLLGERVRIPTPQPATPAAVAATVAALAARFAWRGPIGCTFPAVIRAGVAHSAANVDPAWVGVDVAALLARATGCPVTVLNDADAAGLAEARFGAARGVPGVVLVLTFGTGIGSALLLDGRLLPNTELGHMEIRGREAEDWAADRVREAEGLGWAAWAERVTLVIERMAALLSPDLVVVGGGVSEDHAAFLPLLRATVPVRPAELRNRAGIIGAALAAGQAAGRPAAAPGG